VEFNDRFGEIGGDPLNYWSYEIAHILHMAPDQIGEATPADLVGALAVFDALYRNDG
jgi:hypothetical protein